MTRIVAGSARGRPLAAPVGDRTRPTSDRVREALFSILVSRCGDPEADPSASLAGLSVCDLYAGSGAVGLEAASRGAGPVTLVESDRRAVQICRRNVAQLGLPATVAPESVESFLARTPTGAPAYDIVFADPPYAHASAALDGVLAMLWRRRVLAPDGLVVVERSSRSAAPDWPPGVADAWSRAYGETTLHFAEGGA